MELEFKGAGLAVCEPEAEMRVSSGRAETGHLR